MQFDEEKDFEKDGEFSLEDDGSSISWEDLLNSDEDIDLEKLVKKDAIGDLKDDLKADNIDGIISETETPVSAFDTNTGINDNEKNKSLSEINDESPVLKSSSELENIPDVPEKEAQDSFEEPELKTLDELSNTENVELPAEESISLDSIPQETNAEENFSKEELPAEPLKEEQKPSSFDLKAAADNYVNSLSADDLSVKVNKPEEAGVSSNETSLDSFLADIPVSDDNGNNSEFSLDDIPISNDFSFTDDNGNNKDLSGVVDDELLSLLDTNNDVSGLTEASFSSDNSTADFIPSDDDLANKEQQSNDDYSASSDEGEDNQDDDDTTAEDMADDDLEEEMPIPKKKKGFPLLMAAAMLGLTAIISFAIYIFAFPKNQDESADMLAGKNQQMEQPSPKAEETKSPENPAELTPEQAKDVTKAEREELINKLEGDKADAKNKDKAEKKEKVVVNIPVSGRSNPFLPSLMFGKDGFAQVGTDLSSPPDETMLAPDASQARELLKITVSGIMYDSVKPSAIVKFGGMDYFVQKGDRIDNYRIIQITKDFVAMQSGSNTYKAYVGETFNAESPVNELNSVKTINGSRQYISASDIEINKNGAGG